MTAMDLGSPRFRCETTQMGKDPSPKRPSVYWLRLEYVLDAFADLPIGQLGCLPNWFREFTVSGKVTLEQLSEIILGILGWDHLHLYEFRIHDRVYAQLVFFSEDDLFVE